MPSLFEARRRLLTSATNHDVRPTNRSSRFLAGTEASTSFLFFDVPRPLPCGSGDTARAALRPLIRPQCWFRPLAWVCPTVMPRRTPHHESGCPPACGVRIDVHGSKDRAKDASPGACDDHSCVRRVHTLRAHARPRSPPRRPPDIRCRRRARPRGRNPRRRTGRPRSAFRRRPAKSDAFPKTRMPFTVATREALKETILQASRRLSHSRRPHRPGAPDAVLDEHCEVTVRSPADP